MSDPTCRFRKVFIDAGHWPEQEISPEEADRLKSYLVRYYKADTLFQSALIEMGDCISVTYHNQEWPNPELVEHHRANHGNTPFRVFTPVKEKDQARLQRVVELQANGDIAGYAEHILGREGELLSETRMTAQEDVIERLEYTYDESGEIVLTREYDAQGRLCNEISELD